MPGASCWPGALPYSSEQGFASRRKPIAAEGVVLAAEVGAGQHRHITSSDASHESVPCLLPACGRIAGGASGQQATRLRVAARSGVDAPRRQPTGDKHIPLGRVVALAEAEQPSRLPPWA